MVFHCSTVLSSQMNPPCLLLYAVKMLLWHFIWSTILKVNSVSCFRFSSRWTILCTFYLLIPNNLQTVSLLTLTVKKHIDWLPALLFNSFMLRVRHEDRILNVTFAGCWVIWSSDNTRDFLTYKLVLISNLPCSEHIRYSSQRCRFKPKVLKIPCVYILQKRPVHLKVLK